MIISTVIISSLIRTQVDRRCLENRLSRKQVVNKKLTIFAVLEKCTTVEDMETIEFLVLYAAGERDFHNIDLSSASLACADLKGANLIRANLRHANLRWADLRQTDLSWADLRGADLSWANLAGANLSYANLKGAKMPDGTMHE